MPATKTIIASGRVPASLKKRVDDKIKRRGWSPSEVIAHAYVYIDNHDDIPWMEDADAAEQTDILARFDSLVTAMPIGTPLDTLTPSDLKEELANRD